MIGLTRTQFNQMVTDLAHALPPNNGPSKNYRRSIDTQVVITGHNRLVVHIGHAWPGNRNDIVVARATLEHVLARLKDWQILRQYRRRGDGIDQALHAVAYLYNLRRTSPCPDLRVNT